jgi:hypothetical protein
MNTWIRIFLVSALALMVLEPVVIATGTAEENTPLGESGWYCVYKPADLPTWDTSRVSVVPATMGCSTGNSDTAHGTLTLLSGPSVSGVPVFPVDHIWNTRVDSLPVDSRSADYVGTIGSTAYLHADFGSGLYEGNTIGIPYTIVNGSQQKKTVLFEYADESDFGPYPIPDNPLIEGGSDHHLIIIDRDAKMLYELFAAEKQADGSWIAGSGAVFNLSDYTLRPSGWTSADAAGLAILPGLVRYDEVSTGEINHALRFTAPATRRSYIWPARHYASSLTDPAYPPMGQRFRLKSSFNTSGYPYQAQIVLSALKKYGMILSDNGAPWYITGAPDEQWNNDALHTLHQLKGSDFEAVDSSSLMIYQDSGQALIHPFVGMASHRIGVFRNGVWYLRTSNTGGNADITFGYGNVAGDIPVVGDWDGDGIDTIGVYRKGVFHLRNSTTNGIADITFGYGNLGGDTPVVGDWDGDGIDTIGVYRNGVFFLRNSNTEGIADITFTYGQPKDVPVIGDWTGSGKDTIGVYRNGVFYLRNSNTGGIADTTFGYGNLAGDTPVVGDWTGSGRDTIGVYRNGVFYLRNSNTNGIADIAFPYGQSGDVSVVGDWTGT